MQLVPDDILELPQPETSPIEDKAAGRIKALVTEAFAETTEPQSFVALHSVTEEEPLEQEEAQNSRVAKLGTKADDVQEGDAKSVLINISNSEIQPLTNDLTRLQNLDMRISNSLQGSKEEKPELLKHQPPRILQSPHKPSRLLVSLPTTSQSQHNPSFVSSVTTEVNKMVQDHSTIHIPQSRGFSRISC